MQILSYPPLYSSAYGDVIFQVGATPDETVALEILADDKNTVIGKKRFTGATLHRVNVAGYGRQQLDVVPVSAGQTALVYPPNRIVSVTLRAEGLYATTSVSGGIESIPSYKPLSLTPEPIGISPSERAEFSVMMNSGIAITVQAKLSGDHGSYQLPLCNEATLTNKFVTLYLSMPEIEQKIAAAGAGNWKRYRQMEVQLLYNGTKLCSRTYKIIPEKAAPVRLCWWNRYGQIDAYTMNRIYKKEWEVEKERIYTQQGYQTIGCSAAQRLTLLSEYESRQKIAWLSELIGSPRVWIDNGTSLQAVEVLSNRISCQEEPLARIELELTPSRRTQFPTR